MDRSGIPPFTIQVFTLDPDGTPGTASQVLAISPSRLPTRRPSPRLSATAAPWEARTG